ncbi:conserved hypothetical protein [Clostridium neonatale]|uniref:hypothetical protein n=1 Tax=Clostridium neonatale TaxID=137838 RepID=UPI00291C22E9|nr:hypothetical protein [Clostridium neonatale]CAI3220312.1 conserved hypothetical protein [Clostridium neonatale]
MAFFSERNVIKELKFYPKSQFQEKEVETNEDGSIFYHFTFVRKGVKGYITATYIPNKKIYKSIDMDCNFGRPAGYNNYAELKDVMDHIRFLFKK